MREETYHWHLAVERAMDKIKEIYKELSLMKTFTSDEKLELRAIRRSLHSLGKKSPNL